MTDELKKVNKEELKTMSIFQLIELYGDYRVYLKSWGVSTEEFMEALNKSLDIWSEIVARVPEEFRYGR